MNDHPDNQPRFAHAFARFQSKDAALWGLSAAERGYSLIQAGKHFLAYATADAVDADAADFAGQLHVREIVRRCLTRRAFVDVDTKAVDLDRLRAAFLAAFGAAECLTLETSRGYHLVADVYVSVAAQQAGLMRLAAGFPGIDEGAVHSLRLASTVARKADGAFSHKPLPAGLVLSQTLVQPPGSAPDASASQFARRAQPEGAPDDALVALVSGAIAARPDAFRFARWAGEAAVLERTAASHCAICDCEHERDGVFFYLAAGGAVFAYCLRDAERRSLYVRGTARAVDPDDPGPAEPCSAVEYEAPLCRAPTRGDYIDASPCGVGKSLAAWASIGKKGTVLCVSYRKTFSAKVAADQGLESYAAIKGPISPKQHKRVVVQVDSLDRVEGQWGTVLVDEYHGIRRQLYGPTATRRHRDAAMALHRLIKDADRVIVLDADAHDGDADIVEALRGARPPIYRNVRVAHADKTLWQHDDAAALEARMLAWVAEWQRTPVDDRTKLVVFAHAKRGRFGVEGVARRLIELGLRVRFYHAETDQVQRARDFADVGAAFSAVDCVVYNATLEAGVSVELPDFRTCLIFSARLGDVEVLKQAIHRFRCVTDYHYAETPGCGRAAYRGPTSLEGLQRWHEAKRRGELPRELEPHLFVKGIDLSSELRSASGMAWALTQLELYRSASHYTARLIKNLAATGFAVRKAEPPVEADAPVAPAVAPELPRQLAVPWAEIVGGADVSREPGLPTVQELETGFLHGGEREGPRDRTLDEIAAQQRVHLCRVYLVAPERVDAAFVAAWGNQAAEQYGRWKRAIEIGGAGGGQFATTCEREQVTRIDALLGALGLGSLAEPVSVAGAELQRLAAAPATIALAASIRSDWGRVFPGVRRSATKELTPRAVIETARTLVRGLYRCELASSDPRNPRRGDYKVAPANWPESEAVRLQAAAGQ